MGAGARRGTEQMFGVRSNVPVSRTSLIGLLGSAFVLGHLTFTSSAVASLFDGVYFRCGSVCDFVLICLDFSFGHRLSVYLSPLFTLPILFSVFFAARPWKWCKLLI